MPACVPAAILPSPEHHTIDISEPSGQAACKGPADASGEQQQQRDLQACQHSQLQGILEE